MRLNWGEYQAEYVYWDLLEPGSRKIRSDTTPNCQHYVMDLLNSCLPFSGAMLQLEIHSAALHAGACRII